MSGPYAQAAGDYWAAGWRSVLPLPARAKKSPPHDYTGWNGTLVPSWPDVMAWAEQRPDGNICLRLPLGVIGLDVDNYDTKLGAVSLEAKEHQWGALPATWRTTSRDDGVSGIRLYRVPVPAGAADLPRSLDWPGSFGPGTETIHYGHRYVVAPPSVHPDTERAYRWINPDGVVSMAPPRIAELPELPWAWVVGLTQGREARAYQGAGMDEPEIKAWLDEHGQGEPCGPMSDVADHMLEEMHDGAHESLAQLMRLVGLAAVGHQGLLTVLPELRRQFIAEVTSRPAARADEAELGEEWRRSLFGAVDKVLGEMAKTGTRPSRIDPCDGVLVSPAPDTRAAAAAVPGTGDHAGPTPGSDDDASEARSDENSLDMAPPVLHEDGEEDSPRELTETEAAELAAAREETYIQDELRKLRRRDEAQRRLEAESAPALELLDFGAFLASPEPEPVVEQMLYVDSLSRIYGKPGCGKSFLALDLAFHVALGRDWGGRPVRQGPVVYVMAEGQRVNTHRAKAWLERHDVSPDELQGKFWAVPDKVVLTEAAAAPFVKAVAELKPALIILDTQNAMQVGNENDASDTRVMRDALTAMRRVTEACVVLIGHTGKGDQEEARGSGAARAAMDTEIKVDNDGASPAHVTVTVTRDKAAEDGAQWDFFLRMQPVADSDKSGAVLVPMGDDVELPRRQERDEDAWQEGGGAAVPAEVLHYEGEGGKALPDLARWMAYEASPRGADPGEVGRSMADAVRAFKGVHGRNTVTRAWSILQRREDIAPAEGVKSANGRHVWTR